MTPRVDEYRVTGDCWLGCERTGVPVIWLGPLQWDGQHAPVYSCKPCLDRLKAHALALLHGAMADCRLTRLPPPTAQCCAVRPEAGTTAQQHPNDSEELA